MNCNYFFQFYMVLSKYDFNHKQFCKFYYSVKPAPRIEQLTSFETAACGGPSRDELSV